jgi:hypothetical protein
MIGKHKPGRSSKGEALCERQQRGNRRLESDADRPTSCQGIVEEFARIVVHSSFLIRNKWPIQNPNSYSAVEEPQF